jgi:hypothetical protein
MIIILIEFLVGTNEIEYLFRVPVKVLYDQFKNQKYFGEALKPFIGTR